MIFAGLILTQRDLLSLRTRLIRYRAYGPVPSGLLTPCWLWAMRRKKSGYAVTNIGSGDQRCRVYVHRLAYELWKGPIPPKLQLDHLCRTRHCFNPDHLEAVTQQVNIERGDSARSTSERAKRMTAFKCGHTTEPANVCYRTNGSRSCLQCNRAFKGRAPH